MLAVVANAGCSNRNYLELLKGKIMTKFFASVVAFVSLSVAQRSRAKALKRIKDIRGHVRKAGALPKPGSAFATAGNLVWGACKYQAIPLTVRERRSQDTSKDKWIASCDHAR